MPELPEVETTRRGLEPHLQGRRIHGVILRRPDLRWPIPLEIERELPGQRITAAERPNEGKPDDYIITTSNCS